MEDTKTACRICGSELKNVIQFGKMPIANGFLTKEEFESEYFFDLELGFCPNCAMAQLMKQPDREKMFHEHYAFFSSTSRFMREHFRLFAEEVMRMHLSLDNHDFVVEIGSNDGIMLENFAKNNIKHLGIEPSANVAEEAIKKNIHTLVSFFDKETAEIVVKRYGNADVILAANVMCHIPYMHSIIEGVKILLKPQGVLIFEDPYLGDIIQKTAYDQIYDEHVFYFSLLSLSYLFEQHGMEIIDIEPQVVHGGSMRYVVAQKQKHSPSQNVYNQMKLEKELGLNTLGTFQHFKQKVTQSRDKLMDLLNKVKRQGKRVVGYAATSKSTTVINYCGITPEHLAFICDTTPIKQGKYSPGMHIPVLPHEEFIKNYPNYALLFGWNHAAEIMEKESDFIKSGGCWITYVPEVKVIDDRGSGV